MSRLLVRLAALVGLVGGLRRAGRDTWERAREPAAPFPTSAGVALSLSMLGSAGFIAAYAFSDSARLQGLALGLALGGFGTGLILWAKRAMPMDPVEEPHEPTLPESTHQREVEHEVTAVVSRRGFVVRMLAAAAGALGLSALVPLASLGPAPGRALHRTSWAPGVRVVGLEGNPVRFGDLGVGEVLTVFPEGGLDDDDSAVMLVRVDLRELTARGRDIGSAPGGYLAYSRVCTHAGCPVALYQRESRRLFCPCHQSLFDVIDGAEPISGPATRPLPQLPLYVDEDGVLRAQEDFPGPVGPGFWRRED
jgi:ubiquinol-cytochrome c reductase iron-sulfur subunit